MSFSSVEFTRAPEVSAEFAGRVRGLLRASALGDALGYPLELLSAEQIAESAPKPWDSAFGELLVSDDTQLTCFTLDALTEVLEWNNEGAAADELACLWLAYLRWFRGIGESLPESAPFSLDREIDGAAELTARRWLRRRRMRCWFVTCWRPRLARLMRCWILPAVWCRGAARWARMIRFRVMLRVRRRR